MKKVFLLLTMAILLSFGFIQAEPKEIITERSFTSKTYSLDECNYKKVLSSKPIHFLNVKGQYQEITDDQQMSIAIEQMNANKSFELLSTNSNHEPSSDGWGCYSKHYYEKEIITFNGMDYDTTYSWVYGYLFDDEAGRVGNYITTIPDSLGPGGVTSECWRALLSWDTNGSGISSNGTVYIDSLTLEVSYLAAATSQQNPDFNVQFKSLGDDAIETNPTASDYNSISSASLITTEDLSEGYYWTEQTVEYTCDSGVFYNDFTNCWSNQKDHYVMGFKHESEDNDEYRTEILGGDITIYYTVHEVELANQRVNSTTDLSGTLTLDNIAGHTSTDYTDQSSGTSVPVYDDDSYTVKTNSEWLVAGNDSIKHINWNEVQSDYKLSKSNFTMTAQIELLVAKFDTTSEITLASSAGELEIRDPWYVVPGTSNQPDTYQEISPGTYKVFLEMPIDGPVYYSLRAPAYYVTSSDIMVFDGWAASPGAGATFGNASSTTTSVEFNSAGVSITAQYVSANTNGRVVTVSYGETLTIPAGATYNITPGDFKLMIFGKLYINIATTQPVTFQSGAVNPTNADWGGIEIYGYDDVVMQYVTIRHAENPVYIHAPSYSNVHLNYSTIENCRNGIYWGSETYSEATDITNQLWIGNNCIRNIGDDDHENPGIFIKGNLKTVVIDNNDISGCYGGISASFSYTSNQMQYSLPSGILINHNVIHDLYSDDSTACGIKITDNSIKYRPATLPYGKIVNNTIDGIDGYGIKAKRHESGLWYIRNTIISEIGEWNSGAGYAVYNIGGGNLPVRYSTFYAVENSTYGCNTLYSFTDNPDYVSASDYHLQSCSPCIDAGDPEPDGDGYTWTTDNDDRDPDGTRMDIGVLYCDYPPSIPTGFNGVWYNNHPKVYWSAVSDPDLDYYEVWKRRDGVWSLKTTTTALYYVDTGEDKWTKPMAMETIYYRVRSVDEGEHSSGYTLNESFIVNNKEFDKEEFYPTVEIDPIPAEFCLHPAYPNPFNATATLKLDLPEETRFSLAIYDIAGNEVWRLNNRHMNTYSAGYHTVQWNGQTNSGSVVPTGVYFIVYRSTEHQLNQKVVLVK